MGNKHRNGFTLIEVLIVVVIMAVLAATVIPQFSSSATDAKNSSLTFNMRTLRSQIELYKWHHGSYPTIDGTDLPQLTHATNSAGETGAAGDAYPYGPYIDDAVPPNPFDGKNRVVAVTTAGDVPTAVADADGGWQYDATTGGIYPNNSEYYPAAP